MNRAEDPPPPPPPQGPTLKQRYREHPRAVRRVVGWLVLSGLLALLGFGAPERLHSEFSGVPNTPSAAATALEKKAFGATSPLLVLLTGPPGALDAGGPRVARALQSVPSVSVLSPWQAGADRALRPRPGTALLLLQVHGPYERATVQTDAAVRRALRNTATPPLHARVTGYIDISNGVHRQLIDALRTAELVSVPLLMVVLLLLLGTPVAAAIPGVLGGTLLGATAGVLDLINRVTPLDATALSLAAGISLALGVDYSLLVLARYREERARGLDEHAALGEAVRTAGRTVRFAGLMVAGAMIVAFLLSPGAVLASATAGSVVAVVMSLIAATFVLPSVVLVADPWVERWRVTPGLAGSDAWARIARRIVTRPGAYFALAAVLMLALGAVAATLKTGPPSGRTLTPASPERRDFEDIGSLLGEGWAAPFEVLVQAPAGTTITERPRLLAVARFARELRSMPRVQTVLGPQPLVARTTLLARAPAELRAGAAASRRSLSGLAQLSAASSAAATGSDRIATGLQGAAGAAGSLVSGTAAASQGAGALAGGIDRARSGATVLRGGIGRLRRGTSALVAGASALVSGSARLHDGSALAARRTRAGVTVVRGLEARLQAGASGLEQLRQPVRAATAALQQARAALDGMLPTSKADPQYATASQKVSDALAALTGVDPRTGSRLAAGYPGLDQALADASAEAGRGLTSVRAMESQLAGLSSGLDRLAAGSAQLTRGGRRLGTGLRRLAQGGGSLAAGAGALAAGLSSLAGGGVRLDGGLGAVLSGVGLLRGGLAFAAAKAGELGGGLEQIKGGVAQGLQTARSSAPKAGDIDLLTRVLGSGYATLAALSIASSDEQAAAGFALNTAQGGTTARVLVVKRGSPQFAGDPLRRQLENAGRRLQREAGVTVAVGGPGPVVEDFDGALSDVLPVLIAVLVLLAFVALVVILRAPVLALIAVALNVVTLAAVVGVLSLAFSGAAPLGGPGFMDDVMLIVIVTLVFGLSIDYEVFLLMRVDEAYTATHDVSGSIVTGVRQTAGVITAAAIILATVFVAFSIGDLVVTRELGVGMVVGVLIDATVVRLILLPTAIRGLGDAAWWAPRALRRAPGG